MEDDTNFSNKRMNEGYRALSSAKGRVDSRLLKINPKQFLPTPQPTDYDRGAIMRYFVRKFNDTDSMAMEVDETHYKMCKSSPFYGTVSCVWMIRGPQTDEYDENGVFQNHGVSDSNKREAFAADKKLNGVWENLHDYTQFYKPS